MTVKELQELKILQLKYLEGIKEDLQDSRISIIDVHPSYQDKNPKNSILENTKLIFA